jgi:hypothetical protein
MRNVGAACVCVCGQEGCQRTPLLQRDDRGEAGRRRQTLPDNIRHDATQKKPQDAPQLPCRSKGLSTRAPTTVSRLGARV